MTSPYLTQELRQTLTFILAGGQGERLKPLTLQRAKPAVPFGGPYRIIDFTLSNCIHSGLRRIYVLTQYQARSLEEHIRFGWNFLPRRLEQFISVSPPHHGTTAQWYAGTADAIYRNLDLLEDSGAKQVLILSGDHIYKMDYGLMLEQHMESGAALTIGAVRIPASEARRFGVFEVDADDRVIGFQEKPAVGREVPGQPGWCLGSMGIYVFEAKELARRLRADAAKEGSKHDFGRDVIPAMMDESAVFVHRFVDRDNPSDPYWRDVGTIDAYYEANMDLVAAVPRFNLYDRDWPIYSLWHADPPAKTVLDSPQRRSEVLDSLLCPGVVVSGGRVKRSILSNRVHVDEQAQVEDSILLGGVRIGKGARIQRAILDKWTVVPDGATVGHDRKEDERRGFGLTSSGIVVVPARYDFAGGGAGGPGAALEFSASFPRPGE